MTVTLNPLRAPVIRRKYAEVLGYLKREDLSSSDKAVVMTHLLLQAVRLGSAVHVTRSVAFELAAPPAVMRGLRDLVVRRAEISDLDALLPIEDTPRALVLERFARGDLCYIGQLDGQLLCHCWFHRGPQPFAEDQPHYPLWEVGEDAYLSYAAAASRSSQASGVFVKVFQTGLRDLFREHGAKRVQCLVRHSNQRSVLMHERLGFERIGGFTMVLLPWVRLLRWDGPLGSKSWLTGRANDMSLPLPPVGRGRS